MNITATILTLNAERHLEKVIQALASFDEILVLDSGSTDRTQTICSNYSNVRFTSHTFDGFGRAHNLASKLAKNDWILSIDADEVPSQELIEELKTLQRDPKTVYDIPFHNIYRDKWIKWCGWYPESHIRLYHRQETRFTDAHVHERVLDEGLTIKKLQFPILHYSYDSLSDFLVKMERYSTLFATQYQGKRKATPLTAITHSLAAFFKSYILKKGFLGGFEGFVISSYNAHTAFYKYLKLYELNASSCVNVSSCRRRKTCQHLSDIR